MVEIFESTDAPASQATSYRIEVGQFFKGNISGPLDSDYVKIHLKPGTYSFGVIGTSREPLVDPQLSLRAIRNIGRIQLAPIIKWDNDSGPKKSSSFTVTITSEADYLIDISGFAGSTGQYKLSVQSGSKPSFDTEMGAAAINGFLERGYHQWNNAQGQSATLTYSFRDTWDPSAPNFSRVTETQKAVIIETMNTIAEICNIHFSLVEPEGYSNDANIIFGNYSGAPVLDPAAGFTHFSTFGENAFVWFNQTAIDVNNGSLGSALRNTVLHETLHALGLTHSGDYNAFPLVDFVYGHDNLFIQDTSQFTAMSYFDGTNTDQAGVGFPYSPCLFDIFALQQIYGANLNTRAEDNTYGYHTNAGSFYEYRENNTLGPICIWDAGGIDTIDASICEVDQVIDLREDQFSNIGGAKANVSIAHGVIIEGAIGGLGNDKIFGNSANNTLEGGSGDDVILGFTGNDIFNGFFGKDVIDGGDDFDKLILRKNLLGLVWTSDINAASDLNLKNVEQISVEDASVGAVLNLSRQTEGFKIQGNDKGDEIIGSKGNDFIDGRGGADKISGSLGKDQLLGGDDKDIFQYSQGDSAWNSYDTILDFGKSVISASTSSAPAYILGDSIDFTNPLTIGGSAYRALYGQAQINQLTGIASFTSGSEATDVFSAARQITARFDTTLPSINNNSNTAGDFAFFKVKGNENYFLFVSDGVRGIGANDLIVELAGIRNIGAPVISGGDLYIS